MTKTILICFYIIFQGVCFSQRSVSAKLGDTLTNQWISVNITLKDSVFIQIEGPSKNWFALGFQAQRMQNGVDMIMVPAWKEAFVNINPYDAVLTGYTSPKRDRLQHWIIRSESMKMGRSTYTMVRPLSTFDKEDYDFALLAMKGGSLDIIWAMGPELGYEPDYHGNQKGIFLFNF